MPESLTFLPAFIANSINTCISVLLLAWPYLKTKQVSKWKLFAAGAVGCLYGLIFFGNDWQTGDTAHYFTPRTYFLKLGVLFIGFFLMKHILHARFWQFGFVSSIMGQYVAGMSAVSSDFIFCVTGEPAPFLMNWMHLGVLVALVAITLPLMLLFSNQITPLVNLDKHILHWHWLYAIPLLFNIIFNIKFYRGGFLTYGRGSWSDLGLALVWFAATYGAYAIVLHSLNRAVQSIQYKEKLHLAQVQADMHREQNARLCEYADDVRRAEHDLRHHFVALKGMADAGDCAGIQTYLESWNPRTQKNQVLACANPALEAVLNYYLSRAVALGAKVEGKVELPAVLGAAESDVCMVFANLTENALEALQKQDIGEKHLHVDAKLTRDKLMTLCVSNSCVTPPVYCNGVLWSSKRDHAGVGTASVNNVAEQRHGFARYKETAGTFTAFVCMNLAETSLVTAQE